MGIEQSLLVKLIAKCADDEVKVEYLSYSHYAVIIRKPSSPKPSELQNNGRLYSVNINFTCMISYCVPR